MLIHTYNFVFTVIIISNVLRGSWLLLRHHLVGGVNVSAILNGASYGLYHILNQVVIVVGQRILVILHHQILVDHYFTGGSRHALSLQGGILRCKLVWLSFCLTNTTSQVGPPFEIEIKRLLLSVGRGHILILRAVSAPTNNVTNEVVIVFCKF